MALVEWEPRLSVGIDGIDAEHRQLIGYINQLHDAMREGRGKEVVGRVCDSLVTYTKNHFGHEEQLLRRHRYTDLAAHVALHTRLTTQVTDLQKRLGEAAAVNTIEMMTFLRTWLTDHILQADKKYSGPLAAAGAR